MIGSTETVDDGRRARLQARAAELRRLLDRVAAELAAVEEQLDPAAARAERARLAVNARNRRWRAKRQAAAAAVDVARSESCGSERGYQWHRLNGPWPLPPDDPCGCRAAHAATERGRRSSAA